MKRIQHLRTPSPNKLKCGVHTPLPHLPVLLLLSVPFPLLPAERLNPLPLQPRMNIKNVWYRHSGPYSTLFPSLPLPPLNVQRMNRFCTHPETSFLPLRPETQPDWGAGEWDQTTPLGKLQSPCQSVRACLVCF